MTPTPTVDLSVTKDGIGIRVPSTPRGRMAVLSGALGGALIGLLVFLVTKPSSQRR